MKPTKATSKAFRQGISVMALADLFTNEDSAVASHDAKRAERSAVRVPAGERTPVRRRSEGRYRTGARNVGVSSASRPAPSLVQAEVAKCGTLNLTLRVRPTCPACRYIVAAYKAFAKAPQHSVTSATQQLAHLGRFMTLLVQSLHRCHQLEIHHRL